MEFTSAIYLQDCQDYANEIIREIISGDLESLADNDFNDYDFEDRLLQIVDGSQYAIWTYYHLQILASSENADYGMDSGIIGNFSDYDDFSGICQAMAFWAIYADIQDHLTEDLFEAIKSELIGETK